MSNILTINKDLISYLELPPEVILLTGAKILANTNSEDDALHILQSLQASNLNLNDKLQHTFVTEMLLQFNQILQTTTIDIWKSHNRKTTQETAANKLKAKMAALETTNATKATAQAIQNAFSNINDTEKLNANSNLRLANLEKNLKRQEQKTNEISNTLRNKNKNQQQKNYKGSRHLESATSPSDMTPKNLKATTTHHIVDLTEDESKQHKTTPYHASSHYSATPLTYNGIPSKKQKRQHEYHTTIKGKTVQWRPTEEMNYYNLLNPAANASSMSHIAQQGQIYSNISNPSSHPTITPPFFPPAPAPTPLLAPTPNPFHNNQQNIFNAGAHNHFLQHNLPGVPLPFHHRANLLQNPFIQQKDVKSPKRFQQKRKKSD